MHLFQSLGELIEAPGAEQARIARMLGLPGEPDRHDFTNLFVVQLFPYASIYLSQQGYAGGAVRDRMGEFWRILGRSAPPEPDHATSLMKCYGSLLPGKHDEYLSSDLAQAIRPAVFWEGIACWLPIYLLRARELASTLYRAWSDVAFDVVEAEAAQLGPPATLPVHLASAPMPPSISSPSAFVDALFAPVVSGVIICRADLARCAIANRLNLRMADRRHTLKLMLSENTTGVSSWLHDEIGRQAENLQRLPDALAPIREHWLQRALAFGSAFEEFRTRYATTGESVKLV
jgi:TorA maturation chaperone TorD